MERLKQNERKSQKTVQELEAEEGEAAAKDVQTETSTTRRNPNMNNLVYLCVGEDTRLNWYVLDTDSETCNLDLEMTSGCKFIAFFSCIMLNSKIYAIGGEVESVVGDYHDIVNVPIDQVLIFDTLTRKWEDGPKMLAPRMSPTLVTLDDERIYAFGCHGRNLLEDSFVDPWAEFYDSKNNKWFPLPKPPLKLKAMAPGGLQGRAVFGTDTIILWTQYVFCSYDVSKQHWNYIMSPNDAAPLNVPIYSSRVAVLDDTIYWCFLDVFGFDFATNKAFDFPLYSSELNSGTVSNPLDYHAFRNLSPFLVVTGKDELCLIWCTCLSTSDMKTKVYCKKFKTKRSRDPSMDLQEVPMKNSEFVVHGVNVDQFAGVLWQNNGKGKHNKKPRASGGVRDMMAKLSRKMYVQNYNLLAEVEGLELKVVESADGKIDEVEHERDLNEFLKDLDLTEYLDKVIDKEQIDMNRLKILKFYDIKALGIPLAGISLDNLLQTMCLKKYLKKFLVKNIDINTFKQMNMTDLEALHIPSGPRRKLLQAIRYLSPAQS